MARKIQPRSKVPKPKKGQSSEEYWRERESRQRAINIRDEARTAERINEIFQSMQDSIQQEIESFYQRYADKEGITLTEARGRVSRIDMEQYERLAKKYVEAAHHGDRDTAFSQEANDQMRLYNLTMKVNRLEMLKARCGIRAMEGYRDTERLINENLEERAYSEYRRLAGILGNSVQFNENMVRAIVNASYQNATWSQRLWNHQASLSSQIGTQLASGILTGKSSTILAREIQKLTGGSTYACQRLMRTELRRVQTEAALQSMTDNGVAEYKFMVENGVNPCDECLALDGQVFKLSDMNVGKNAPPVHPNCVLPDTKIIAPGMEAIMQSDYSGDIVEFCTADGARLSVTPNHIVLTARGWVRAKDLVKGDKVIHYIDRRKSGFEIDPADDNCVPTVEKLFTTLIKSSSVTPTSVPASAEDLKSDVVPNSKIEIVFINRELWGELNPATVKLLSNVLLVRTSKINEINLPVNGSLDKALMWYGFAADGIMCRLSERGIFLGSSVRCTDLVRFRTTADYNSRSLQVSADNRAADTISIGKSIFTNSGLVISNDNLEDVGGQFNGGVRRDSEFDSVLDQDALNCFGSFMDDVCNVTKVFAGIVQFDDVVSVASRFYSGHVYDTSSMSTLYTANGIITSNCHCATAPYVDEAKWQRWLDGPAQDGVPWAEYDAEHPSDPPPGGSTLTDEQKLHRTIVNNAKRDREQFQRYRKVLGDMVPDSLESFQQMKYNNTGRWNAMKHNYRIVNSYEINAGSMTPEKILQLDDIAFSGKKGLFTGKAKSSANIAVMELDGVIYYANSRAKSETDWAYINFKGDKDRLVLMKSEEDRRFTTTVIGTHDRCVDSEAKLFEYAADVANDGKQHVIRMLSERCMCDSCLGVMRQFKKRYSNVNVNAVSGRRDRSEKNKNNPWKYRK